MFWSYRPTEYDISCPSSSIVFQVNKKMSLDWYQNKIIMAESLESFKEFWDFNKKYQAFRI